MKTTIVRETLKKLAKTDNGSLDCVKEALREAVKEWGTENATDITIEEWHELLEEVLYELSKMANKQTEKTDAQMITDLKNWYPEKMHIVGIKEIRFLENALEFDGRDILSLRNLRNTVTLTFAANDGYYDWEGARLVKEIDKMSAITSVIDNRIAILGGEIQEVQDENQKNVLR